MKRSEINQLLSRAILFFAEKNFYLPPFAHWSVDEWQQKGTEVREIVEHGLGWDITDFGSGDFNEIGLLLFTLRNGASDGTGKCYAEKAMIVEVNQKTPMHFHWHKQEDIINRGGGILVIEVYNATAEETLAGTPVILSLDGVQHTVPAGTALRLAPGESITLTPYLYHTFWGEEEAVFVGEVSAVNDDSQDNRFLLPAGRFPDVVEDEPPFRLMVGDYSRHHQN